MRALRQTYVLTPATKVAVNRSVMLPTTNFTYVINRQMHMYKIRFITLLITNMFQSLLRSSAE